MMRTVLFCGALLAGSIFGAGSCIEADSNEADPDGGLFVCDSGAAQPCMCTNGRVGAQECKADGSGWAACVCEAESDSDTDTDSSSDTDMSCVSNDVDVCLALLSACGFTAACELRFCDCVEDIGCDSGSYYLCGHIDTDTWNDTDSGSDTDVDTDTDSDTD